MKRLVLLLGLCSCVPVPEKKEPISATPTPAIPTPGPTATPAPTPTPKPALEAPSRVRVGEAFVLHAFFADCQGRQVFADKKWPLGRFGDNRNTGGCSLHFATGLTQAGNRTLDVEAKNEWHQLQIEVVP